jgi:hypothetical protein
MGQILGKFLITAGILAIVTGILFFYSEKFSFLKHFGRLPGDIHIKKDNFSFHFPITTSILISLLLSFIWRMLSKEK